MKKKEKYVVAVKDTSSGDIRPGKPLGQFRKLEFAMRDWKTLAEREFGGMFNNHRVGIFLGNTLVH